MELVITGTIMKASRKQNETNVDEYYVDGTVHIDKYERGELPDSFNNTILFRFKNRPANIRLQKGKSVFMRGNLITQKRNRQIIEVVEAKSLIAASIQKFHNKEGINATEERTELGSSLMTSYEVGTLPKNILNIFTEDIKHIADILHDNNLSHDIETAYQIKDFFTRRAALQGYDFISQMLLDSPYILSEVDGFSFSHAKLLAEHLKWTNPDHDSIVALAKIISEVWRMTRNGHTYMPLQHVATVLGKDILTRLSPKSQNYNLTITDLIINKPQNIPKLNLSRLTISGRNEWKTETADYYKNHMESLDVSEEKKIKLVNYWAKHSGNSVYLSGAYFAETSAAKHFSKRLGKKQAPEALERFNNLYRFNSDVKRIDSSQKEAIENALKHRVSVIVGPAGSGKTEVITIMARIFHDIHQQVEILAPSAMAASIASQKAKQYMNIDGSTIHRFARIFDADDLGIKYNRQAPYMDASQISCIIIDEMSMCDILAFSEFLHSIQAYSNIRLVLVGDIAQIPAIGPSGFFHQLVRGQVLPKVPVTTLTGPINSKTGEAEGTYRKGAGSEINKLALMVREGKSLPKDLNSVQGVHTLPQSVDKILEVVKSWRSKNIAVNDILVLSDRRNNEFGTNLLNEKLRPVFLDKLEKIGRTAFYIGDSIVAISNDYAPIQTEDSEIIPKKNNIKHPDRRTDIYNGMRGTITTYTPETHEIRIKYHAISQEIPYYESELAAYIEPAYALTVHKAQGSEAKYVLFVPSKKDFSTMSKNILYTAITRARNEIYLVGDNHWQTVAQNITPDPFTKFAFRVKANLSLSTHQEDKGRILFSR